MGSVAQTERVLRAVEGEPLTVAACAALSLTATAYLLSKMETAGAVGMAAKQPGSATTVPLYTGERKAAGQFEVYKVGGGAAPAPAADSHGAAAAVYTGPRKSAGAFEVYKVEDDDAPAARSSAQRAVASTPVQPRDLFESKDAQAAAAVLRRNLPAGSPAAAAVREWTENLETMADYIESLESENEQLRLIATPEAAAAAGLPLPPPSPAPLTRLGDSTFLMAERQHQSRLEDELEAVTNEISRVRTRLGSSPAGG